MHHYCFHLSKHRYLHEFFYKILFYKEISFICNVADDKHVLTYQNKCLTAVKYLATKYLPLLFSAFYHVKWRVTGTENKGNKLF